MRKVSLFCASAVCIFFAGCTHKAPIASLSNISAASDFVSFEVEFNARQDPNSAVLETASPNKNCPPVVGKLRQGCVSFKHDTFGMVTFVLQTDHSSTRNECSDPGVKWVITKVEGTDTPSADNDKGSGWGSTLPLWITSSFYPIKDPDNGVLYEEADVNLARSSVTFLNTNINVGAKVLWYRVTATKCVDNADIIVKVSDPRIENDGRN